MKFDVRIAGTTRTVAIERNAPGELRVSIDSRTATETHDTETNDETTSAATTETMPAHNSQVDVSDLGGGAYSILLGGMAFDVQVVPQANGLSVLCRGQEFQATVRDPRAWRAGGSSLQETHGPQQVTAPMPGRIVRVLVTANQRVEVRQALVVVEAMKMQNEIRAPKNGLVDRVFVREGQAVTTGEPLVSIA